MKFSLTNFANKINIFLFLVLVLTTGISEPVFPQSDTNRIRYANKDIFISGIDIAWSSSGNFAQDLGPKAVDVATFTTIFTTVHENGGNVLRLWLHTNGEYSPSYDANGYVTGPGPVAIQNLKQILALAQRNNVGLILCIWTHNMLSTQQLTGADTAKLNANVKLLTDTSYTMAYIRNALIPMVDSLKGDPAIVSWEIFNEPEGISAEYGPWSGLLSVHMSDIQRCVNLMTGAIHRADPSALVTSGAVTFQTLTDITPLGSAREADLKRISSMSVIQQKKMTDDFNQRYRTNLTQEEFLQYLAKIAASPTSNYYRDDRLVAAGGDTAGKLDFYSVHYYYWNGATWNPFTHAASYWQLDKPVVVAEFHMDETNVLGHASLYPTLYQTGYAGALAWSWTDFASVGPLSAQETWDALNYMFMNYHGDIVLNPTTGTIYLFTATPRTIQKTDNAFLEWDVEPGSTITLNGQSKSNSKDSVEVIPLTTTTYTLIATGQVTDTAKAVVTVLPTGRIMSFAAVPIEIGTGENTSIMWQVVKGSSVALNGESVPVKDSIVVLPDSVGDIFTLIAQGDERDSSTITITVLPPGQVDRAFEASVSVSSNDTVAWSFSNPQNIVDGNNISRWQAGQATSQLVQLDLGRVDSINSIIIRWGNKAYAKQYSVQASSDLANWSVLKQVFSGTGGTNYVETFSGLNGVGRYLDFLLQVEGNGPYSIAEIYVYGTMATGIVETTPGVPATYSLSQNYPNPFNPATKIEFAIPKSGQVHLAIYDVLGRKVADLTNKHMNAGNYQIEFDTSRLSSGVYFYTLRSGGYSATRKMVLLK